MPTDIEQLKQKYINYLKNPITETYLKLLEYTGAIEKVADGTVPEHLRNKDWGNNVKTSSDFPEPSINDSFEQIDRNKENDVYTPPTIVFNVENNFVTNNYQELPDRPSSLLPLLNGDEGDGQSPTQVVIGAPITLAQSLESQSFGKMLYSPFSTATQKIRQIGATDIGAKLTELNDKGIEAFAGYLAEEEGKDALDAMALFVPTALRGMSGQTTVLFGKDTIKFFFSNFTASSVNALVGVSSDIPSSYEIVNYEPSYTAGTENVEGIVLSSSSNEVTDKIYQILGGDSWIETEEGTLAMQVKPEDLIKNVGNALYSENSTELTELTVTNLLELHTVFSTVDFYRSGHHRLPATVLTSLQNTEAGNTPLKIYDVFTFHEWLMIQLDSLIGEFPIKIKNRNLDEAGNTVESEISLTNISESIAEFMGLVLNIAQDSDLAINIGMKGLVESMKASNAAITTFDYAKANAEYLGYKGNDREREVKLSFTPGATNLKDALKPSIKKIISWENNDKETLVELIKKTLIGTEIVKAAMFQPFKPGDPLTGDAIAQNIDEKKTQQDFTWETFKQRVRNPSGQYNVPKPNADIKDLSVDQSPQP